MRKKISILAFALLALPLLGVGCSNKVNDAGILRSLDGARSFENKSAIGSGGTLAGTNVVRITFNPSNSKQIIIGTQGNGFYFSENQGESWQNVAFSSGNGNAVAIDPTNQDILYLALNAKIYKSEDGGKTFREVYTEQSEAIQDIAIDPTRTSHIYALASSGNLVVSNDGGDTWKVNAFIVGIPNRLLIDPKNVNHIFIATLKSGVYVSTDGGASFSNDAYTKLKGVKKNTSANVMAANDITIDPFDSNIILVATDYGLIESTDGGKNFSVIPTLVIPATAPLRSVKFHPTIKNAVFLSALNKFYTSTDLAVTWAVLELPTAREVYDIAVSPENSNELYLGIKGQQKTRPIDIIGLGKSTKK